jgi:hypothetical protein
LRLCEFRGFSLRTLRLNAFAAGTLGYGKVREADPALNREKTIMGSAANPMLYSESLCRVLFRNSSFPPQKKRFDVLSVGRH